jgi:hypothetical protein
LPNGELLLDLLKQQLDRSLETDEDLRSLLQWLDRKASEIGHSHHGMSALRAFYCGALQNLGLDLASKLDHHVTENLSPLVKLEAQLLHLTQQIELFLAHPTPFQARKIWAIPLGTTMGIEAAVRTLWHQATTSFRAIAQQPDTLETWCHTEGIFWMQQLQQQLMQTYDLGYGWQLTSAQTQQLETYYWANVFLVDCLHRANHLSAAFRTTFKAGILIPSERPIGSDQGPRSTIPPGESYEQSRITKTPKALAILDSPRKLIAQPKP